MLVKNILTIETEVAATLGMTFILMSIGIIKSHAPIPIDPFNNPPNNPKIQIRIKF